MHLAFKKLKEWGKSLYFDIFYSLILADFIAIYLSVIMMNDNILKYLTVTCTCTAQLFAHNSDLRTDRGKERLKIFREYGVLLVSMSNDQVDTATTI